MEQPLRQTTSYKEVRIGNTVYCVTSVFNPEKDLKKNAGGHHVAPRNSGHHSKRGEVAD